MLLAFIFMVYSLSSVNVHIYYIYEVGIKVYFCLCEQPVLPRPLIEKITLSVLKCHGTLPNSIFVSILGLSTLFHRSLCSYIYANTIVLDFCIFSMSLQIRYDKSSNSVLSQNYFGYSRPFALHMNFEISVSILIGMLLNLQTNLRRTDILTVLSFPIFCIAYLYIL